MDNIDVGKVAKEKLKEEFEKRGHANVLIAGRTGVGKSTLINSVFQGNLAHTGQGRPVTANTREITREGIPLSVFDTRGLEMADFPDTLRALRDFLSGRRADPDGNWHIHVAWVCVSEDLRRVEDAEMDLTEMLAEFVPVIGVITKARADQGFRAEVQRLLPAARNVLRVRAIPESFDDGYTLQPMGLEKLVELTMELFPEGHRMALVAAQKASLKLKRRTARGIMAGAAATAAGIGATPIPFADAALIVPVQVGMLAGISSAYGLSLSRSSLTMLVASTVGGAAASLTGRAIVGGLLKLIPGVGWLVGGAINASTAAAITVAFGETYIATLDALFASKEGEQPDENEVVEEMKRRMKEGKRAAGDPE